MIKEQGNHIIQKSLLQQESIVKNKSKKGKIKQISFKVRDKIFFILLHIISRQKKHKIILKNHNPNIDNVIYAVSHYSCHDFKYASEIIGKRSWVLVGKQRFDIVSLCGLLINGIVWVNRKSKRSKIKAVKHIESLLLQGENVVIFPEGTWNMSYSLPILPLYWGIIDIARDTNRPIVPLVLDYDYNNFTCTAAFGKPIFIRKSDDKRECINNLRDEMSTLKWNIWTEKPVLPRAEISIKEWNDELDYRLLEYPLLDIQYEKSIIRNY